MEGSERVWNDSVLKDRRWRKRNCYLWKNSYFRRCQGLWL